MSLPLYVEPSLQMLILSSPMARTRNDPATARPSGVVLKYVLPAVTMWKAPHWRAAKPSLVIASRQSITRASSAPWALARAATASRSCSSYWPMSAVYAHGMAPFSRSHATATEVSSPPEKAMPMRSPTGTEDRMAMGDDKEKDRGPVDRGPFAILLPLRTNFEDPVEGRLRRPAAAAEAGLAEDLGPLGVADLVAEP